MLYRLQRAGYPFTKNDLDLETWEALYIFHQEVEAYKWAQNKEDTIREDNK
jgi:hypothetical protein